MGIFDLIIKRKQNKQKISLEENDNQKKEKSPIKITEVHTDKKTSIKLDKPKETVKTIENTETITKVSNDNEDKEIIKTKEEIKIIDIPISIEKEETKITEEQLEIKIIESIEKIITEDLYELETIKFKIDVINDAKDEEIDTREIEILKETLDELLIKFEEIKKQYENITYISDSELQIDNNDIYVLVNQYKASLNSADQINITPEVNQVIKQIEDHLDIILIISNVEKTTEQLNLDLDDKLDKLNIRDDEFKKMQDEYADIESIKKEIENFTIKQDSIIKDLEYKIETTETITKKIETETKVVTNFNQIFNAIAQFHIARKFPPTPAGMILKTGMIMGAVNSLSQIIQFENKQKEVINITYTDYLKDIQYNINNVNTIIDSIESTQSTIENLSSIFKKHCEEYRGQLPQYDEMFKKLENTTTLLNQQKHIALHHKDAFNAVLAKNNIKVKKLEALKAS